MILDNLESVLIILVVVVGFVAVDGLINIISNKLTDMVCPDKNIKK